MSAAPVHLALVAGVLALPALLGFRGSGYYSRGRRALLIGLRLATVAALIAVAGEWTRPETPAPRELVALVDTSASIGPEQARAREAFLDQVVRARPAGVGTRVVRFAAAATPVALNASVDTVTDSPSPDGSNLAEAIETAKGLVTPGRPAAFLLLSDGEETAGSSLATVAGLRQAGIEILARDYSSPGGGRAVISRLSAPRRVIPRERFEVKVGVRGASGPLAVRLARGDEAGEVRDVRPAGRGEEEVSFLQQAPRAGTLRYRLRLEGAGEAGGPLPAEERIFEVQVAQPVPVTLLTDNPTESRLLRELLESGGSPVTVESPESWRILPDQGGDPGVLVLDNVPAPSIGAEGIEKIDRHVRTRGAGLLVFGGMQSLGAGSYGETPLESILPAAMDAPGRGPDADLGLVIVLDTSLSMFFQSRNVAGATGPPPRKIELAKAAVLEIVRVLRPEDQIGVLASRDQLIWVRRPAPLGDREELEASIRRILAIGGGINFYSSIREAHEALRGVSARIRHIMVLADADDIDQLEVENVGRSVDLVRGMAEEGVTLSIFALGFPSDKDVAFLRQMTQLGRGDFYLVANTLSLPRYFRSEYQRKTGERIREEVFSPLVRSASPALRGLDTERLPELAALNLVAVKPGAEEILVSPQGAPLLALWRYGRGRAAVFTSDSGARWARAWFSWAEADRFWMQLVHELAPRAPPAPLEAVAERAGDRLRLLLHRQDGGLLPLAAGAVRFEGSKAGPSRLERRGLHQFEALLPPGAGRGYSFQVEGDLVKDAGRVSGTLDLPPPPEFRPAGRGKLILEELVQGTGGGWVQTPAEVEAKLADGPAPSRAPLFWLLLAALLGLFGEALLRY